MKGYLAMQKMDLICDEYIREAEIDVDTAVVISEKGRFGRSIKRFMNSPVGVAMLCAVVSLSVLAAIVMAGTSKWGGWTPPAGTVNPEASSPDSSDASTENETETETETETLPPINLIPEVDIGVFEQYLESHHFVGDLDQSEFIDGVLGKFSYEGTPLSEFPMIQGDGELEDGGYVFVAAFNEPISEDKRILIDHSTYVPKTDERSYSYSLTTQVPLEGLLLPYNLAFAVTFAEACEIMGLGDMTIYGSGETVLYRIGNETLTLTVTEDMLPYYTHLLTFTQTTETGTGTRSISISFGEDKTLREIGISVYTKGVASFGEATPSEAERLSPDVETEIKQAFFDIKVDDNVKKYYTTDDLSIRYFGTYNGGYAVFVDGIFDYTTDLQYETVLGIGFEYSSGQKLLYYKDGRFYSLSEAAGAGLLGQTDIQKLHEAYSHH